MSNMNKSSELIYSVLYLEKMAAQKLFKMAAVLDQTLSCRTL